MAKKRAPQGKDEASAAPTQFEWEAKRAPTRRKRRGFSWVLWLLLPLAAAAAVASMIAPTADLADSPADAASHATERGSGAAAKPAAKGNPLQPPPSDTHNASECMAWAGDGA